MNDVLSQVIVLLSTKLLFKDPFWFFSKASSESPFFFLKPLLIFRSQYLLIIFKSTKWIVLTRITLLLFLCLIPYGKRLLLLLHVRVFYQKDIPSCHLKRSCLTLMFFRPASRLSCCPPGAGPHIWFWLPERFLYKQQESLAKPVQR